MAADPMAVRDAMVAALAENLYVRDAVYRWYEQRAECHRLIDEARKKGRNPNRSVYIERQRHLAFEMGRAVNAACQVAVTGRQPFAESSERAEKLRGLIDAACLDLIGHCEADPRRWVERTRAVGDKFATGHAD